MHPRVEKVGTSPRIHQTSVGFRQRGVQGGKGRKGGKGGRRRRGHQLSLADHITRDFISCLAGNFADMLVFHPSQGPLCVSGWSCPAGQSDRRDNEGQQGRFQVFDVCRPCVSCQRLR